MRIVDKSHVQLLIIPFKCTVVHKWHLQLLAGEFFEEASTARAAETLMPGEPELLSAFSFRGATRGNSQNWSRLQFASYVPHLAGLKSAAECSCNQLVAHRLCMPA